MYLTAVKQVDSIKYIHYLILYCLFLTLSFPFFYFVYKFGDPEPLAHDFFQYYWLYKDFDIGHVIAPHNMRLAGAYIVHLFYKVNIYYDTATAFDKYQDWGFLKQVYFDALLFNFISVATTCVVLFQVLKRHLQNFLVAFSGALLYLLGFGTIFYELMPLTDAFSILLFTIALKAYLDKKLNILFPLAILIFQREYILIAIATLALMDAIYYRDKYFVIVFIFSSVFFLIHVLLRKTLFYTHHLDYQSSAHYFSGNLLQMNYPLLPYLKQLIMTLNLFFIYLGIVLYKKIKGLQVDAFALLKLLLLLVQINLICHLAGHGNNCGRYFYLVVPLVIFMLIKEFFPLLQSKEMSSVSK